MVTATPAQVSPQMINHAYITYQTRGASHKENSHWYDLLITTAPVLSTSFNQFIQFCKYLNQALSQAALTSYGFRTDWTWGASLKQARPGEDGNLGLGALSSQQDATPLPSSSSSVSLPSEPNRALTSTMPDSELVFPSAVPDS